MYLYFLVDFMTYRNISIKYIYLQVLTCVTLEIILSYS